MKTLINLIIGLSIVTLLASCGGGNTLEDKKAELEKLKGQQNELKGKIASLEEEIVSAGGDTTSKEDEHAKVVSVTPVALTSFTHSVDVQGRVEGDEIVTIYPKMQGSISKIYLRVGSQVRAGQVIAEIENEAVRAQMKELKTNYDLAKQQFDRQKNLWDQKIGSEIQYLQAKTNKESLEARIAQINENLDMYLVKSPINGVVDDMPLKLGQVVSPVSPAGAGVRVVNLGDLKVKADLSESYAGDIKDGDKVELYFPDINKSASSSVSYSSKAINATSRTFGVEIKLPTDNAYRPNMVSEIRIIDYKKDNAFVVPINTLQQLDGKDIVYLIVKEGKKSVARKREVKVGKSYNGKTEILSGLKEGDQLITTGYQDLNDGEIVKL